MNVRGKFYLLVNVGASASSHFVAAGANGSPVFITTDPRGAAFFDTSEQAQVRQKEADAQTDYEILLCRANKDLPPQLKSSVLRPVET